MDQMLYHLRALIEGSLKIFFPKFSDYFGQSYKRSKFWGWGYSHTFITVKSSSQTQMPNCL